MDNSLSELSVKDSIVRNILLIGLYLAECRNVVNHAVDPYSFDVGDVAAFDFVGDVIVVPLKNLLLPQDLCLQLFFITVGQSPNLLRVLVE